MDTTIAREVIRVGQIGIRFRLERSEIRGNFAMFKDLIAVDARALSSAQPRGFR